MGRLGFIKLLLAAGLFGSAISCTSPSAGHDLEPLEEAVAGVWTRPWRHLHNPAKDFEVLELNPDRTGAVNITRSGSVLTSHSFEVERWKVRNDTLILDMMSPGYSIDVPGSEEPYMRDTLWWEHQYALLWMDTDSLIVKEMCRLEKMYCDGVTQWSREKSLQELLNPDSGESSSESKVKRPRQK